MSGDAFTKAKQALLASGLPLEMSVEHWLRMNGFGDDVWADFTYWRHTESGQKDFSVDVHARQMIPANVTVAGKTISTHAWWDLLIECKYRNPSVKWIFAPLEDRLGRFLHSHTRKTHYVIKDRSDFALGQREVEFLDLIPRRQFDGDINDPTQVPLLVSRGVEFRPGGSREESDDAFSGPIRRGVYQLQFAQVPRLAGIVPFLGLERSDGAPRAAFVHVSTLMLVTTAELWRFRPQVDLQAVESARVLEDIAERVEGVEYVTIGSPELRAHQERWLKEMEATEPMRREVWRSWGVVNAAVESATPSVLIVHHDNFGQFMRAQHEVITKRIARLQWARD